MRLCFLLLTAAAIAAAAAPARAGTVTATYGGLDYSTGTNVNHDVGNPSPGGVNYAGSAGRFLWTVTSVSASPGGLLGNYGTLPTTLYAFCVDLNQYAGSTSFTETLAIDTLPQGGGATAMGSVAAGLLGRLYGTWYDYVKTAVPVTTGVTAGYTAGEVAAAFQLAVWEIVQDGYNALNLSSGRFQVNATVGGGSIQDKDKTLAKYFLDNLGSDSEVLLGLYSTAAQDQMILVPLNEIIPVPLPGAAAAALPIMMLIGGALKSKRRHQREEELANA